MKRTAHPEFKPAWNRIRRDLANILKYANDPEANRKIFDHLVDDAIGDIETLKAIIPSPELAIGQKVRVIINYGFLNQTGTVLQLYRGIARVMLHDKCKTEAAFHLTDLEPVSPNL